ncbi:hypothetical protein PM082_014769 [Marasmius tenuissimus]|nr:hypothetical protein PM082_014769 [Marasmius tenuissimus]
MSAVVNLAKFKLLTQQHKRETLVHEQQWKYTDPPNSGSTMKPPGMRGGQFLRTYTA